MWSICVALLLVIVSVQGQLTVTRNGTTITDPVLIYQDEIIRDDRTNVLATPLDGTLICRSENQSRVGWHFANGRALSTSSDFHFRQRRTGAGVTPSVSRLSTNRPNQVDTRALANGLWTCRLNRNVIGAVPLGIYVRGGGHGVVTNNSVSLSTSASSSLSNPPTFTLVGDTSGGPPTTYTWTRNGQVITNNVSYSISIQVRQGSSDRFRGSHYRSTLSVTGVLPGVYQYSVTNRATSGMVTDQMNTEFEGPPPTSVTVQQNGLSTVFVMWTAPSPLPTNGYQVLITRGSTTTTVNVIGTSQTISVNNQYGVHSIQVVALSRPFPSEATAPVEITVKVNLPPAVSTFALTATSVNITWTQPEFSLPVVGYKVTVTRVTGSGQVLCSSFVEEDQSTTSPSVTTTTFTGLQEFSSYLVRVTATFSPAFDLPGALMAIGSVTFTTLSSAPTLPPRNVTLSTTSRSVSVSWSTIECIERNGEITNYTVVFQEQGGAVIPGEVDVMDRTFTSSKLTPHTNYTFRIAGVNNNSTGPYTTITVQTDEDTPGAVSDLTGQPKFTSIVLTWSVPHEPNGVIISYEVTYRVSDGNLVTTNTTDVSTTFTISQLTTGTNVTEITVSAYTSVGRGPPVLIPILMTLTVPPPVVIQLDVLSATSVRVSWDTLDVPEITGYIVYYSQTGNSEKVTIANALRSTSFVVVTDLTSNVEYQFEVVAVAELGGAVVIGERTEQHTKREIPTAAATKQPQNIGPIIGGVVALFIAVIVVVIISLILLYLRKRQAKYKVALSGKVATVKLEEYFLEPEIEEFPTDTTAIEGEGVFFKVVVRGHPQPSVTWYHGDIQLTPDYSLELTQDGSLSITSTELKHNGVYKLLVKNSSGSAEREVRLTVRQEEEEAAPVDRERVEIQPMPVTEFGEYVAYCHSDANKVFKLQYSSLDSGDERPKTVGTSKKNVKLNRFANITVYDHNRITLNPLEDHPDHQEEFVNACYIDGHSRSKKFIATQGPKDYMLVDFWRLVWQERPPTIVMVTNLKEGSKKKCEQYWPDSGSKEFGPFKVTLTEQQVFADYTTRTMQVTLEDSSGRPLKVKQYHYTSWPDHGVPEYATSVLSFHKRVISQHRTSKGPILVHCSAGVGRTGTFICIDNVLEQVKKEKVVDIAGAINKMRHQRMKMVQTPDQYIFLHDAILESVTCGDTEISSANLRAAIKKLNKFDPADNTTPLQTQFKVLEQVSPQQNQALCSAAIQYPERNRSDKFLPADRSRVLLSGEFPDYIHAVSANGYKQKNAYIIAEGPMESTTRNMWKLIYDRKCGAVVMLTDLIEDGMESSYQYWPAVGQLVEFREYAIDTTSEEQLTGFTIRKISILHKKSQRVHQVTQFHITCWAPDGQCSNLKAVVDVIEEVVKIQRRTGSKPVFVHCSDTVTRSGMFCAMATLIDRCKTEGIVDVFQVVKALRTSKPSAVPTMENYMTIFDAMLTFLDSFDTYANFQQIM